MFPTICTARRVVVRENRSVRIFYNIRVVNDEDQYGEGVLRGRRYRRRRVRAERIVPVKAEFVFIYTRITF